MKVLMVCLGNICRSPIAEGILQDKIDNLGLDWKVDSAGTSGWHNGEHPHYDAIEIAHAHDIDIKQQRSRLFTAKDFDTFDIILVMDSSNYQDVNRLARSEKDKEKVKFILNYAYPDRNKAVPDPYYEGGFPHVFDEIENALNHFIKYHQNLDS